MIVCVLWWGICFINICQLSLIEPSYWFPVHILSAIFTSGFLLYLQSWLWNIHILRHVIISCLSPIFQLWSHLWEFYPRTASVYFFHQSLATNFLQAKLRTWSSSPVRERDRGRNTAHSMEKGSIFLFVPRGFNITENTCIT